MSISVLQAENVKSEPVVNDFIDLDGDAVRKHIRTVITEFNASAIPVPPSALDILVPYMNERVAEFSDVLREIEQALVKKSNKTDPYLQGLFNRRDELIGEAVATEEFKQFRSKCYADYNLNIDRYNELQDVVIRLKPFLGMPGLPSMSVPMLDPALLLQKLVRVASGEPLRGQMILRVDEPFHEKPMFWPKGLANGRLDKELAGKFAPVPYPLESVQARSAESKGAFLRRGVMCFPIEDGVPIAIGGWHSINSLLPFSLRSLCVPAAPTLMPAFAPDLRDMFDMKALEPIYHRALAASNNMCVYCGSSDNVKAVPFWRFREPLKGGPRLGVQILNNIWALCGGCKDALRPSSQHLNESRDASGQKFITPTDELTSRLILINHWTSDLSIENARTAYAMCVESQNRRNAFHWMVDVSLLKNDYLVLRDHFEIGGSGWIDEVSGQERKSRFKIVGAGFLGPGNVRVFFSKPSIFDARWDDTVDSVSRRLDESDMTIIERSNLRDALSEIKDVEAKVQSKDGLPERGAPVDVPDIKQLLFDPRAADYEEAEIASGKHLEYTADYDSDDDESDEVVVSVPADHEEDEWDHADDDQDNSEPGLRPIKF